MSEKKRSATVERIANGYLIKEGGEVFAALSLRSMLGCFLGRMEISDWRNDDEPYNLNQFPDDSIGLYGNSGECPHCHAKDKK